MKFLAGALPKKEEEKVDQGMVAAKGLVRRAIEEWRDGTCPACGQPRTCRKCGRERG
jgi:hypothetical protein